MCCIPGISPADHLKVISVTPVSAYITWSKSPDMTDIPHMFQISCQGKKGRVHRSSTPLCSKLLKDLKPQTEYTVRVSTMLRGGGKSQECSITFTTSANQESFLQDLGLLQHQKKKLALSSVLEISHDSIYKQSCECMKDLPLYFLRKLMWYKASSSCASVFDKKTGVTEKVNPLDLTTAIFHCSDPFLQQTLCSKMSQCQLAVPLLLPNCDTQQSTLMLWAMRDIVKKFRPDYLEDPKSSVECRIATTPIPLVSFVRLGKSIISKSLCLNKIFGQSQQCSNTFVHYDMECGDIPRKISDGLVEMSWYLPSGIKNIDVFQQPIAFANLRGDIRMFETQFSFLCQTSAAVFVVTNDSEKDVSILTNKDRTSQLYLVIPEQINKSETDSLSEVAGKMKDVSVIVKSNQNDSAFINILRKHTAYIVQKQQCLSVKKMSEIAHKTGLLVDENCSECDKGKKLAKDIVNGIKDISQFKAEVLPCQGHTWKEISSLEREKCKLKKSGQVDIEQYKSDLNKEVNNLRAKQRDITLSRYITYFIDRISKKGAERSYFLKSLRMSLDTLTHNKMADLKDQYKNALRECPENKKNVQRLEEQISQCSLGVEHFFREVGQLYESASQCPDTCRAKQLQDLPDVCAQLLLEGFPLELLDGHASNIPQKWIEDIFNQLKKLVKPKGVISVVTVLGVQSTGKSTLLNTMFGIQFAVSSGKCTRGAFMQLVKVSDSSKRELKCDFILVLDTEGLKSPELAQQVDSFVHDNELATLVIGLSDVTIINISMENATEMKDILQIAVHAFLRMKQVGKKPRCLFVHQNVADVAAHDSNLQDRQKMIKQLNEMTEAAATMENTKDITCFTDVMDYDPEKDTYYIPGLWQGTPPMASVSAGYSEAVYELKRGLMSVLKGIRTDKHDLFKFMKLMKELWQAVRFENFIFNFRNSLVAEAYSKLCQEWDKWEWKFQKEMYEWSLKAETRISNCGMTDPDFETLPLNKVMLDASQKLNEEEKKLLNSLQHYFDNRTSNLCLIEKYRAEFEMSIKSLRRKTEASMVSSLQAALDFQNAKKRLRMINITQSQAIEAKVLDLLKSCKGKESDVCDEILKKEFDSMWTKTKSEFPYKLHRKYVATDAFHILQINFRTFSGHVQKLLIDANLPECGKSPFKVDEILADKKCEIKPKTSKFSVALLRKLQDISNHVIKAGENLCFTNEIQKKDYKPEHLQQLLHTTDKELQRHDIKFDEVLEASLKIHIFGIATREFQRMHDNFIDQNDPQKSLERAKEKFLLEFMNLYRDQDQCQRKAAEFVKSCLKPAVLDYVTKRIGPEIVELMKLGDDAVSLSTRSLFQYRLLCELLENHKYEEFKEFINCYETYVKDWLFEHVVQKMSQDNTLQQREKALIDGVLKKIIGAVTSLKHNPRKVGNVLEFITHICSRVDLILPDNAVQDFMIMNSTFQERTNEFAEHLEEHIKDMLQSLNIQYEDTEDIKQRLQSLPLKPQDVLFKALFGCGKQCPFCSAPCEAGGVEHKEHFASIHRPQGTSAWHGIDSKVIVTAICSSSVISDRRFYSKETEWKSHPYKDYRKFYPEWNIPGDASIEATAYWKYFMANFNEQIAKDYDLKPAIIPDDWKALTKADALKSLQQAFYQTENP
ncbi:hypothetical protein ACEWY4_008466 [Coilia grayii]|uniref:Interferon-induced very large GTPase 1-like n=1 Tax=Coilia grayii TaxID=363190 RepID=A0ABD1KBN6_9TELE